MSALRRGGRVRWRQFVALSRTAGSLPSGRAGGSVRTLVGAKTAAGRRRGNGVNPLFYLATFLIIVVIALVLGLAIIGVLRLAFRGRREEDAVALGVLKERFARGEISEEEYERARRVIKG